MNKKIEVIVNPETKKITLCAFSKDINWDKNQEYIFAKQQKSLIELTEQDFNNYRKNYDEKGTEYVYIDGKIQEYVEPLEVKLESAKALKSSELQKVYASEETWKITIIYEPVQTPALLPLVLQHYTIGNLRHDIQFANKNGLFTLISLSTTKAGAYQRENVIIGLKIKNKENELSLKISNAKTIKEIEAIDIQGEFSSIEKVITIK